VALLRFGLAGTSVFLAEALAAFALLLAAPSMVRGSASIRLTTLAGRAGAFRFWSRQTGLPVRTTQLFLGTPDLGETLVLKCGYRQISLDVGRVAFLHLHLAL
jgi:hypothetical protein